MKQYFLILLLLCSYAYSNEENNEQLLHWKKYFESGIVEFQKQNFIEALGLFEKAELESDELERVYYNQGLCHLYMEEYELAEEKFTKSISSKDRELEIMARYNLGHLYYQQTISNSSDSGLLSKEDPQLNKAITEFRNNKQLAENKSISLSNKALELIEKSKDNEKIILAKLKYSEDIKAKAKGKKIPFFQGTAKMNGRPANNAYVYVKSKWDDAIIGTARTDENGQFKIEGLDIGKYQLGASLFDTEDSENIKFSDNILKIPTYENEQHDQEIRGALSLGCPYQSPLLPLDLPYNDSARASGPDSITSSTDWGELTDGRPSDSFPEDHDLDQGYVAFDSQNFQIAMGLPQSQNHAASQQIENSTEPQEPPIYVVTLKGYHDGNEAVLPDNFSVYGLKPPEKEEDKENPPLPELLYQTIVQTTDTGSYEWKSEEFEQKGYRALLFTFQRSNGKRISLHEIEVNEKTKQQNQQQNQDPNENDDQEQDQDQEQEQPDNQEQEQPQENRDLRKILQKVREKSEEAKKDQEAQKFFLRTDKDY